MPIRPRECRDCGRVFDLFCRDTRGTYYDMEAGVTRDHEACGVCGSTDLRKLVPNFSVLFTGDEAGHSKWYPYFDRSLNMRIHSKAHHDRVMKAQNVVHCDVVDFENAAAAKRRDNEEVDRYFEVHDREKREHPKYRPFREALDKGELTDHLPKHQQAKARKAILRG